MNIILWFFQVLLAALFSIAGYMKAFLSLNILSHSLPWISALPVEVIRFIGVCELLGALGLLLPPLIGIFPKLTIIAALCLALVMFNASVFHAFRGEFSAIILNTAIFAIAVFVAYGRWKLVPIKEKISI